MGISVRRVAVQAIGLAVAAFVAAGCSAQPDGPKNDVAPTRAAPTFTLAPEASEPASGLPVGVAEPAKDQWIGAALNSEGSITLVAVGPDESPVKVARVGAQGQVIRVQLFKEDEEATGRTPFTSTLQVPEGVDVTKKFHVVFTGLPEYRGNSLVEAGKTGDLSVGDVDWAQVR